MSTRSRPAAEAELIRAQLEGAALIARTWRDASWSSPAHTGVLVPADWEGKLRWALLPAAMRAAIENVPADGSCMYHCFIQLLNKSKWHPLSGTLQDTATLREALARFFEQSGEEYNTPEYRNTVRMALNASRPEEVTYRSAMPAYADTIRGDQWGGDLEINMVSEMLGVIIHRFEAHGTEGVSEARRVTTFFPDASRSDRGRTVSKWTIIWIKNHFQYVRPQQPLNLQDASSLASSGPPAASDTPRLTVRERADIIRDNRKKKAGATALAEIKPQAVVEAARERMKRVVKSLPNNTPQCYPAANLTQDQLDMQASIELAQQLDAKERQNESDAKMARQLAYTLNLW